MTEGITKLDELLADPMVQLVMERDNVQPDELRRSLERARRSRERQTVLPPHVIAACRTLRACAFSLAVFHQRMRDGAGDRADAGDDENREAGCLQKTSRKPGRRRRRRSAPPSLVV